MAEKLAITKLTDQVARRGGGRGWVTDEAWELMRQIKPGEVLDLTSILPNLRTLDQKVTGLRQALRVRDLSHLSPIQRGERVFVVYYEEHHDAS